MNRIKSTRSKDTLSLIGIFVLFFLLFNVPFIGLPSAWIEGYPILMTYIAICWLLLILIMWRRSLNKEK